MGNCLQRNKLSGQVEEEEEDINVKPAPVNGKKVKIVLSKEELEWLMFELKNGGTTKKIEDALAEIQRNRGSPLKPVNVVFDVDEDEDYDDDDSNWRPSLDSILEEEEEEESERS